MTPPLINAMYMLYNNSTLINIAMSHNSSMSQSTTLMYVNFDINIILRHSSKSTLMNVAKWHHFLWMSQYDVKFAECRNATSFFMNVTMWHQLWWMSQYNINFDITFVFYLLSSTMLFHSDPWSSTVNHGQSWSTIVPGEQYTIVNYGQRNSLYLS